MKNNTSVICAVYSKDPDRFALLEKHYQNLKQQTVDVQPIYIFEDGDCPPESINGDFIIFNKPLTIYEAWNLGLSACRTPLAMNLNLDDRLHNDAIELLEREIFNSGADLIGGDWKICFSQSEVDDTRVCYPSESIPFLPGWPPSKGFLTRLGSGTGERGTYGPATMWKVEAHIGFPRYPYRTTDDYRIQGVSDSIWWNILKNQLNKKIVRVPTIIGNYHSHPDSQAEFRYGGEWEMLKDKIISPY
jgi:hypothetical protein